MAFSNMTLAGLEVKVRGRCLAEWREMMEAGEARQLYEKEEYLRETITLLGRGELRFLDYEQTLFLIIV